AIGRMSGDDWKCARDVSGIRASRACTDVAMKTCERTSARAIDHIANVDFTQSTGCRSVWSDHLTGGQKGVGSSPTTPTELGGVGHCGLLKSSLWVLEIPGRASVGEALRPIAHSRACSAATVNIPVRSCRDQVIHVSTHAPPFI